MSTQTENISPNAVDPYEEVKKLQSLVQKLEHQNEQLLRNQFKIVKEKDSLGKDRRSKSLGGVVNDNGFNTKILNLPNDFETKQLNQHVEEEFIDVDELQLSDDDSWLYSPPNGLSSEEMSLSPYKWLRKDLEDPKNKELQLAKSALVNKLEELSILSTSSQQDAEKSKTKEEDNTISETEVPSEQSRVIDTRTFTRPKKKKNSREEDGAKILSIPVVEVEPVSSNEDPDDDYSPTYDFGYIRPELHQLSDFIDVHEKARMQEESLRQDTPVVVSRGSCSLPRPRKLSNCKLESPTDAMSDTEEILSNHIDNSLGREAVRRPLTSTPTSHKSFNSTHSSPLGSNSSLINTKVPSSLRRSLPNLARGNTNKRPTAKSANTSGSSLPQRYASPNPRQHLQLPSQQTRRESAPNVIYRNSPQQDAHHSSNSSVHNSQSVHKSNLPMMSRVQGRSSLPRPSKLPTARPKIPVPLHHARKTLAEETWSDGCF